MPKKRSRSTMKPGKNAYSGHAGDETQFQAGEMPPGINRGIARITKCEFGVFKTGVNQGETYFIAVATGIEPEEAKGNVTTLGPEPLCDTTSRAGNTTSHDEHVGVMLNYLRQLGADTADVSSHEDAEELAQAVNDTAPYIIFSTRAKAATTDFPNPTGCWHNWFGIAEDYEQEVSDDVEEDEDEVGEIPAHGEAAPDDEVPFDEDDLESLVEAADGEDTAAQELLTKKAEDAGCDEDAIAATKTWQDLADLIEVWNEQQESDDGTEDPEKGDAYEYKPPRAKKSVSVEVTAVFSGKRTCNLKNLGDGTVYKSVSWDKLT